MAGGSVTSVITGSCSAGAHEVCRGSGCECACHAVRLEVRPGRGSDWWIWAVFADGSARVVDERSAGVGSSPLVAAQARAGKLRDWFAWFGNRPEVIVREIRRFGTTKKPGPLGRALAALGCALIVAAGWMWAPPRSASPGWVVLAVVAVSVSFSALMAADRWRNDGYPLPEASIAWLVGVGGWLSALWLLGYGVSWVGTVEETPEALTPDARVVEQVARDACADNQRVGQSASELPGTRECRWGFAVAVEDATKAAAEFDVVRPAEAEGICVSRECLGERFPNGDFAMDAQYGYREGVAWARDYIDEITPG
jgi:hypothetical protein